jgi:hypothetical protein
MEGCMPSRLLIVCGLAGASKVKGSAEEKAQDREGGNIRCLLALYIEQLIVCLLAGPSCQGEDVQRSQSGVVRPQSSARSGVLDEDGEMAVAANAALLPAVHNTTAV